MKRNIYFHENNSGKGNYKIPKEAFFRFTLYPFTFQSGLISFLLF